MQEFLIALLTCSAAMTLLGMSFMAITPILAKRYSAKSRYYAWLVIVIGLIIPFRPHFENAFVRMSIPVEAASPVIQVGNGTPFNITTHGAMEPAAAPQGITVWQIAFMLWLSGAVLYAAYQIMKHIRFSKMVSRWSENVRDEQVTALFQRNKAEIGIASQIGFCECPAIGSPMLVGFVNPQILLPTAKIEPGELKLILKHELIHYKRKDLWYKMLVLVATAIHWFNPAVYFMARAIEIQCELSCDAEVVKYADADERQHYSEAIIGIIKYQSKMKTLLSTNFYGGKKGMKKRIFSIMDMRRKKVGVAVLGCALMLTLGTGLAFAANIEKPEAPAPSGLGNEDTMAPFFYSFRPNPETYLQYSSYGVSISDDGELLLYNGQRVRLFVDEHSDTEAFFYDKAGELNMSVIRNAAGSITGIERIPEQEAQQYLSAFFAGDTKASVEVQETAHETVDETVQVTKQGTTDGNKFELYSAYGVMLSADGEGMYHNGQRVKFFVDEISDGNYETFWTDEAGTANLLAVRNSTGQITAIESISEEQAQKYLTSLEERKQKILNGLDDKVEARIKELYPQD